jgi:hypothetical protein
MDISVWFIVVFVIMWIIGPLSQVLMLVAPKLHMWLGLMEADAYKPEFKWFLLEQKSIAYADLTQLASGVGFLALALADNEWAPLFGIFSCAIYVYFPAQWLADILLLIQHDISPVRPAQLRIYLVYMALFVAFGLYGMYYLFDLTLTQPTFP